MNTIDPAKPFTVETGLRPEHRQQAARGYWRAFSRKLRYPLGPADKATSFIESVLDPTHAISAVSHDGQFLGMAGFKSARGALVGGGFGDLARIYGWLGATIRGALIHVLERDCADETLLMDGIFVEASARGHGVGTALLRAVEAYAASMALKRIRLDVIDTNPRARALYEREGFAASGVLSLGLLKPVFGFSAATQMTKPVGG
ncbi:GNAT family N-acetyltransferase [Actibacterium ureilyticum]|uniref:GNAT family N-acetyltransferase n=1 Tax=Actibacterium ureilyticum TaxID=1590614 RepID=UPI000BAACA18|nr:GNAT family N-acetyltransferase [Actibacterium ureilyticum]